LAKGKRPQRCTTLVQKEMDKPKKKKLTSWVERSNKEKIKRTRPDFLQKGGNNYQNLKKYRVLEGKKGRGEKKRERRVAKGAG